MGQHASANFRNYSKLISKQEAKLFVQATNKALTMVKRHQSIAIVVMLKNAVKNPQRDDWMPNDAIAAIIRNRELVTVMMTRKRQVNKKHLRTDRVITIS